MLSSLRVVAAFTGAIVALRVCSVHELTVPNALSPETLAALLLVPALLAIVSPILGYVNDRRVVHIVLTLFASVCEGLSLGLGLVGFLLLYQWYKSPSAPHLEPLVIILGIATAGALTSSRRIFSVQTRIAEQPAGGAASSTGTTKRTAEK